MTAKEILKNMINQALKSYLAELLESPSLSLPPVSVEIPKNEIHGEYATNIALMLAPKLKKSPGYCQKNFGFSG